MKERGWALPDWEGKQITSQYNSSPETSLSLHCHMTKTKARQSNEGWLRSIGLGGMWREALGGLSSCCPLIRENVNRIQLSTTCSLYSLTELEPMVSRLLWAQLHTCIKSPLLSFPWNNSWVSYTHFLGEKSTAESASQFSLKGVKYTLRSTDPENPEEFFIWWGKSWKAWAWKREVCDCEKAGWYSWAGC